MFKTGVRAGIWFFQAIGSGDFEQIKNQRTLSPVPVISKTSKNHQV
jgi:hypothetical protein